MHPEVMVPQKADIFGWHIVTHDAGLGGSHASEDCTVVFATVKMSVVFLGIHFERPAFASDSYHLRARHVEPACRM